MNRPRWSTAVALAAWLTATGALVFGSACSSFDSSAISRTNLPDRDQFITQNVSLFMERRCGALDCHGQIGRPLRIFSSSGLRMNDGKNGARDVSATTMEERVANYFSVVGLEPEEITIARDSAQNGQPRFTDFLLLLKPLGIDQGGVRHKGGSVLRSTDSGFDCMAFWIEGEDAAKIKPKCDDGAIQ